MLAPGARSRMAISAAPIGVSLTLHWKASGDETVEREFDDRTVGVRRGVDLWKTTATATRMEVDGVFGNRRRASSERWRGELKAASR